MDIKNVKFISAGAGSGKTYTLTEELYKKIAEKEYKPSEIVLTTFTRAAANEFKERARAKLIGNGCLEEADQLACATIGTVHSICLSFLKKYWYRNGSVVVPQEISEKEKTAYISRSLASVVSDEDIKLFNDYRDEFDINGSSGTSGNSRPDYNWWKGYLTAIIDESETFGVKDFKKSREESYKLIDRLFPNEIGNLCEEELQVLDAYLSFCKGSTVKAAQEHINSLGRILSRDSGIRYCEIYEILKLVSDPVDKRNLRKQQDLCGSITLLQESLQRLLSSKKYGEKIKTVVGRLFDLAEKWRGVYASYKKENGLIDYNDMELQFLDLLEDHKVVEEIRGSIRLVMVDEFQDCNQTQIRIFEKLSAISEESIWVGDPKQAIYGFRGSDTELTNAITDIFANIKEGTVDENGLSYQNLGKSYRSVPEVVTFVNELFSETFGRFGLGENMVTLEPERNKDHGTVSCWKISGKAAVRAQKLAFRIKSLIEAGAYPGDIAILIRDNDDYNDYAEELTKQGIPVNMGAENFCDYAEVQMIAAVLKYVLYDGNDLAKAEVMRLFTDMSSGEIITDRINYINSAAQDNEKGKAKKWLPDSKLFHKLDSVAMQVKTQSVSDAVKGVITLLSLRRMCERWGNPVSRKSRLDRLVSMAKEYEDNSIQTGGAASLNGFLQSLTSGKLSAEKSDVSTNSEGVTICTYHKAKGLEWKTVIMDSLCDDSYNNHKIITKNLIGVSAVKTEVPVKGHLYVDSIIRFVPRFVRTSQNKIPSEMGAELEPDIMKIKEDLMKENNRLYYVGMTRAKDNLIILLSGLEDKNGVFKGDFNSINHIIPEGKRSLENRLSGKIEELHEADIDNAVMTYHVMEDSFSGHKEPETEKYVSPSRYKLLENSSSVKATTAWRTEKVAPNKHLIKMNDVNNPEKMAAAGTCIHNVFAAYRPDFSDKENIAAAERIVSLSLMDSTFMDKSQIVASAKEAYSFLEQEYGKGRALKEVPFSMKDEKSGVVYTGEIDLVWDLGEGRCVLVDYKSYPGFDLEAHAMKYAGQLTLYRKALESAGYTLVSSPLIYFNTHGAFVSVEI